MKRISIIVLLLLALVVGVTFTLKNAHLVAVNYYFGLAWEGPLSWLLIITFLIGIFCGIVATLLSSLKRKVFTSTKHVKEART